MLENPITEKLRELKLYGMLKSLEEQVESKKSNSLSFEERLGLLIDREAILRDNKQMSSRLKRAKFKEANACIENIDYKHPRDLDKRQILSFANCKWIQEHHNMIFTGPTGVGKSYLACALAHQACLQGFTSLYFRGPRLFKDLEIAREDGRYLKIMKAMEKIDVLIIDDIGLSQFSSEAAEDFLEIMEDRYQTRSTIVTSQIPVKKWHGLFPNPTVADAVLDRLVHGSYKIYLNGESMRKEKTAKKKTDKTEEKNVA